MSIDFVEWLNLAFRWLHITAGIAWIGSSFYFVWLDNHLKPPEEGNASGEVWSVHGGGFYHKQKYQVAPAKMPQDLHWFKWEAYFTWISGFSLLVLIYYWGANNYLIDPAKSGISVPWAIALALAAIVVSWLFYDLLCRTPVGRDNRWLGALWFSFLLGAAALLDSYFSSKAAYIHIGAMAGTVMVANVFFVIIPNQRKVVADLVSGKTPDPKLGQQAKQRSVHNNYMTLPVLFIMISQHHPMTYGAERPWLVLGIIALLGVAIRHAFNLRHRGQSSEPLYLLIAILALSAVTYVSLERDDPRPPSQASKPEPATYATVAPILQQHCTSCHSANPTDPAFPVTAVGLRLDTFEHAQQAASQIEARAVKTNSMPLGNTSGMMQSERDVLGAWIAAGAKP